MTEAYLDIETTGLSCLDSKITVVGIYLVTDTQSKMVQLVGRQISTSNLLPELRDVDTIYTYNGSRFDLPFIRETVGLDLETVVDHHDLMYDCWNCNLYGGLKLVEQQLGICRQLQGVTGLEAVLLWQRFQNYGDGDALDRLLQYNKEDVMNLRTLHRMLWSKKSNHLTK
jgi:uncharacterized protein